MDAINPGQHDSVCGNLRANQQRLIDMPSSVHSSPRWQFGQVSQSIRQQRLRNGQTVVRGCQGDRSTLSGARINDLKAACSICLLMRNLWDDKQLHHRFQLVERENKVILEESIEIHKVESAKYNGAAEAVRGASVLEQRAYWVKKAKPLAESRRIKSCWGID